MHKLRNSLRLDDEALLRERCLALVKELSKPPKILIHGPPWHEVKTH